MTVQTYPYDDDYMKYNLKKHKYILTVNGFDKETGYQLYSEFDNDRQAEVFLEECSDDIYEFIYENSFISEIPYKQYAIAKNGDIRETFKEVLLAQARYAFRSTAHLLKDQHGVNIEKGKAIDMNSIRGDIGISPISKNKLYRLGLLFVGKTPRLTLEDDGSW